MEIVSGIAGLALFAFAAVLAVCWIILPFIIISKMNKVIWNLGQIRYNLELINYREDNEKKPGAGQP